MTMSFDRTPETYDRAKIEETPVWRAAFALSEVWNDNAPLGWSAFIPEARRLIRAAADEAFLARRPAGAADVIEAVLVSIRSGVRSPEPAPAGVLSTPGEKETTTCR